MKRGLVIGKFLPIHEGHIALIKFAAERCDELIVSMSVATTDTIDPEIRFQWLKEIFKDDAKVKCFRVTDDFDDPSLSWDDRTRIWADFIRRTYPPIHVVFTSEKYGDPFAQHLHADHLPFDPDRTKLPVSATQIRQDPFRCWDFIPKQVRPFFVKKICFFGPESTGKSMMSQILAKRYQTVFVPEVARELITSNEFSVDDIIRIGYSQAARVNELIKVANKLLFCDTDAITTQVYSEHYLKVIPDVLFDLERQVTYDHYFLFDIDVAWVSDGLRDLGDHRKEMFQVFRHALESRGIPYTLVQGDYQTRQRFIERWLLENYGLKTVNWIMQKHVSIKVAGKVQGVFYRATTREVASKMGLKGFVRNEPDGGVYIEAEGDEKTLKEFTDWCKQGPRLAQVDHVDITEGVWVGFTDFVIKH